MEPQFALVGPEHSLNWRPAGRFEPPPSGIGQRRDFFRGGLRQIAREPGTRQQESHALHTT
jgi:hypothetical protein